jgi:DNA adenine methylase
MIEPFAGMAAMTIAVAQKKRADNYILNDLNTPLIKVLESAIENPKQLFDEYKKVWEEQFSYADGSVAHYFKIREKFNAGEKTAANMLYLLARCVKGSVRYNSNGEFNQSPDKRRYGTNPLNLRNSIYTISSWLKGKTGFYSLDYKQILDMAQPGDLVYMDPPYQGVSQKRDARYISGVDFDEFVNAVDMLNVRGVDFLISYDGNCGDKKYGEDMPKELGMKKILLNAGLSSQQILLGQKEITFEALYVSRGLIKFMPQQQPTLFNQYLAI